MNVIVMYGTAEAREIVSLLEAGGLNTLTVVSSEYGGKVPASFKGFADQVSGRLEAGSTWSTGGGSSSNPPGSLPIYMAVIVSNSISRSGTGITGNIVGMVVVKTEGGYTADPGHKVYGTVVATIP